ncbi:hypothetical protein Zmor_022594 [Zophobas morio]|uniref:Carboxylic ester hydrolase n=1 Tax=Zophobas morio TaxID=2755281 RepID=A0AA38I184_9CUCU|nr:hypothetical protein Zmor_022594 [Zophobas morio]
MSLLIFFLILYLANANEVPKVTIPNLGEIQGKFDNSLNGRSFYAFEGVPYAQPPVGDRRFKKPVPRKPWKGTLMAKTIYKCMQYDQYALPGHDPVTGDEDCLYVNIYTPTLDQNANLDVIIYIHGGAFMYLYGGFYGPHFLLDKNVVFVNLNYRLGPLGFLSTEDDVVPGNNGIRDQIVALTFIKDNVKYFGGNPDSITVFGMSAGGASTHIHYLSPKSRGLFHRAMSQSGTALNPWVLMEQPLQKTKKLAASLGCGAKKVDHMVECLRKRSGRQVVASVKEFLPWLYNPFSPFGVVVDSWSSDPVLPDHPYNLIKSGKVNDIPWIVSQTDFEGLYPSSDFLQDRHLQQIDTRWNELLPFILDYNYTVDAKLRDDVSQKIRKQYLGERKVDKDSFVDFTHILSHRLFDLDIQKTAKLQASVVSSPIYFYLFTYCGAHAWYETIAERRKDFGASHAEDTAYLVSTPTADTATTEEDRLMIKFFVEMMTSFASTGVPKAPVEWKPISKDPEDDIFALKIDSPKKISMERVAVPTIDFWKSLPFKENEKLVTNMKDEL